jgi:hypothetical protein
MSSTSDPAQPQKKEAAYPAVEKRLPTRGTHGSPGFDSIEKPEFLAVDLQFFLYGFDVAPNLSNRIGYFFFCFPEALTPMTR